MGWVQLQTEDEVEKQYLSSSQLGTDGRSPPLHDDALRLSDPDVQTVSGRNAPFQAEPDSRSRNDDCFLKVHSGGPWWIHFGNHLSSDDCAHLP